MMGHGGGERGANLGRSEREADGGQLARHEGAVSVGVERAEEAEVRAESRDHPSPRVLATDSEPIERRSRRGRLDVRRGL